ncbi:hypothetical protein [Clostridium sp.]
MTELELLAKIILEITDDKGNLVYVKNKAMEVKTNDDKFIYKKEK